MLGAIQLLCVFQYKKAEIGTCFSYFEIFIYPRISFLKVKTIISDQSMTSEILVISWLICAKLKLPFYAVIPHLFSLT